MFNKEEYHAILKNWETAGPVDECRIVEAESKLGLQFPEEYRDFLRLYGAAMGVCEIYGIDQNYVDNEQPLWTNVVDMTRSSISEFDSVLPNKQQIAISGDGAGYTFFIDTREDTYGQILELGPGTERLVADDFGDFIIKMARGEISI